MYLLNWLFYINYIYFKQFRKGKGKAWILCIETDKFHICLFVIMQSFEMAFLNMMFQFVVLYTYVHICI